jgi:hypothetical protein
MLRASSVKITDLDLSMNVIKEEGALALAAGIAENKVSSQCLLLSAHVLSSRSDSPYTPAKTN